MTEQLVEYRTAKLAKEVGFDEPCNHAFEYYELDGKVHGPTELPAEPPTMAKLFNALLAMEPDKREQLLKRPGLFDYGPMMNRSFPEWLVARPTQDLLERWIRETHGWYLMVEMDQDSGKTYYLVQEPGAFKKWYGNIDIKGSATFELAREQALMYILMKLA